jgi:ElaB/YqjD/DUF883 family membrane-anchored ribosome-binding protein
VAPADEIADATREKEKSMAEDLPDGTEEQRILARIDARRERMGETIEQIGAHLNPNHLKHELREGVREQLEQTKQSIRSATIGRAETIISNVEDTVSQTRRSLVDTIRENPVPAAMAGIGIGWLIADSRRSDSVDDPRYARERGWGGTASTAPGYMGPHGYTAPPMDYPVAGRYPGDTATGRGSEGLADRGREAFSDAADQVGEAADSARETLSHAADRAQDRAGELADRAQHAAQDTWHAAEERAHRVQRQARRFSDENPLAAGAVAMALGFAAGMMIKETKQEHQLMGPTRDRLMDDAQRAAGRVVERAGRVAESAVDAARDAGEREARDEGLTAGSANTPYVDPARTL